MNAVIYLDVPDWQIGQDVTVYFPDTMMKHGKCELLKEQEPKFVLSIRECETLPNHYERKGFCPKCHQVVEWYLNRAHCGFCGQELKWK